jgi:hypothetical protein
MRRQAAGERLWRRAALRSFLSHCSIACLKCRLRLIEAIGHPLIRRRRRHSLRPGFLTSRHDVVRIKSRPSGGPVCFPLQLYRNGSSCPADKAHHGGNDE